MSRTRKLDKRELSKSGLAFNRLSELNLKNKIIISLTILLIIIVLAKIDSTNIGPREGLPAVPSDSTTTPEIPLPTPTPTPPATNIDEEINKETDIKPQLGLTESEARANNVHVIRKADELGKISFKENGALTLKTKTSDGKIFEHTYFDLKPLGDKPAEIHVDKQGKIQEAYFTLSKKQTIVLGNEILKDLPAGTKVSYKDGKALIIQPKSTTINAPKDTIDKNQGESIFYFEYDGESQFKLPNGDTFYGKQIGFKNGNLFFEVEEARIGKELQISNPDKVRTYLDFNGKPNMDYDSAYISLNRDQKSIALGMNAKGKSPSVLIPGDSDFAKDIAGENDNLAIQTYSNNNENSFVYIKEKSASNKLARMVTLNGFYTNTDGKSPYYNSEKQKILVRNSNIVPIKTSENYLGFQLESYRSENDDYKNLINVFGKTGDKNNLMVVGNDGKMAVGPDPGFIIVKSAAYGSYNQIGLYQGVSHWLSYNEASTKANFQKFLGITLNDPVGIPPERIKMLMDIFANAPRAMINDVKVLNIVNYGAGWTGLASPGEVNLHWSNGGVKPGTAIHEITHAHEFEIGYSGGTSKFDRQWNAVRGNSGPHTYGYGYEGREDTSTFGEMIYRDSWGSGGQRTFGSWKQALSDNYPYHKQIRAKLTVFYWNNFITKDQASRILGQAGLSADDASLLKYYNEAIKN